MPKLDCSVSLLYGHEPCQHYLDWQLGKHGIQIVFNDPSTGQERFATFLPEIAPREGMSKPEAIDSLIRKSGVKGDITESLRECLFVTRYQVLRAMISPLSLLPEIASNVGLKK